MCHLFEKYKNLGHNESEKLYSVLESLHILAIVGIHNCGKKTLVKNIKNYYSKYFHINEKIIEKYNAHVTESKLCGNKILVSVNGTQKNIKEIVSIVPNLYKNVHIIVIGTSALFNSLGSYCYIYRCACPSYEEKIEELSKVSIDNYGNYRYVEEICKKYNTYHDCLIALELYNNDIKDIYSYIPNIDAIIQDFVLKDKMTKLQMRTVLYNVMMHLSLFSDVISYALYILLKNNPDKHFDLCQIASRCEYNFVKGNKDIYHYEHFFYLLKDVYKKEKKCISN
jgi:hypothetical protein